VTIRGLQWQLVVISAELAGSTSAAGKAGVRADVFIGLDREAKEREAKR
jgi:hypothetical protein